MHEMQTIAIDDPLSTGVCMLLMYKQFLHCVFANICLLLFQPSICM